MAGPQEVQTIVTLLTLLLVKPLVLLFVVGLIYVLLHKQAVEVRYQVLSAGFLGVLLLFPLEFVVPSMPVYWLPQIKDLASWFEYGVWIYAMGVFMGLTRYFHNLLSLIEVASKANIIHSSDPLRVTMGDVVERLGLRQSITIKLSAEVSGPFVWGWIRPEVILPSDFSHRTQRQAEHILLHEFSHIYRNDWVMLMVVRLLCVLLWFVPGIRWLADKHQDMAEQACDNMVVRCEADAIEYAEDLLGFAKGKNNSLALNAQGQSPLFSRLAMLINGTIKREQLHLSLSDYVFLGSFCLVTIVSSLKIDFQENMPRYFSYKPFPYDEIKQLTENKSVVEDREEIIRPTRFNDSLYRIPEKAEAVNFDIEPFEGQSVNITLAPVVVQALADADLSHFSDFEVLHEERPYYPIEALQRKLEGYTLVTFDISDAGDVMNPEITDASHKRLFDHTALQAIRKFKFSPVNIAGEAHPTQGATVCFKFEIHERSPPSVICPE